MKKYLLAGIATLLFIGTLALVVFPDHLFYQSRTPTPRYSADSAKELYEDTATYGIYDNDFVTIPETVELAYKKNSLIANNVLSAHNTPKRIEVDLTNQRLYAYEGNNKVFDFLVSTGKYGATPTGTFKIWTKIKSQKMSGGSQEDGTYYYLPNVPHIMFFYNDQVAKYIGYGIHGAYWHNNFGNVMSHGCINVGLEDAEKLYYWADPELSGKSSINASDDNPGTEIHIYGEAPWT